MQLAPVDSDKGLDFQGIARSEEVAVAMIRIRMMTAHHSWQQTTSLNRHACSEDGEVLQACLGEVRK